MADRWVSQSIHNEIETVLAIPRRLREVIITKFLHVHNHPRQHIDVGPTSVKVEKVDIRILISG